MKKIILAVIVVAVLGAGAWLFLNLNSVVRSAMETAGSNALGVAVRVSGVDISLSERRATVSGISVANPPGFSSAKLISMESISAQLENVTDKVVTMKDVTVDGLTVAYEIGPGGTNLDALRKKIGKGGASSGGDEGVGLVIERLRIRHAHLVPAVAGLKQDVALPDITLTNLGSRSKPTTPAAVAAKIADRILASSTTAMIKSGVMNTVRSTLDNAANGMKMLLPLSQ